MGDCRCGCGESAENGDFIAGHSQKLAASLIREVGGIFVLQELVQAAKKYSQGKKDPEELLALSGESFL
jgi:hypothetical protein